MLPLQGTTIVAVEQAVAAPFTTRQLADLGARVIKIERPRDGDFARAYDQTVRGLSSHFVWLNRSKESLSLDLKRPEAADVMERLLARADVFVQNLGPGAAERIGLGAHQVRARYPSLVACDISGYGSDGPLRNQKAYDLMVQAESGLLSITGSTSDPAKVGISVADIAAGMYAMTGILSALLARTQTGSGATVEVSMLEALGEWMGYPLYYTTYGGAALPRTGARHAAIAPYGPFTAANGEVIYLAVQNDREWAAFCQVVLVQPSLATDQRFDTNPKRVQNRVALHSTIDTVFAELQHEEVVSRLESGRIAHARLNTVEQFAAHPQLSARDRWTEVGSPVGPIKALRPPWTIEGVEPRMDAIPSIGQQTDALLDELGYDHQTVASWRAAGVV